MNHPPALLLIEDNPDDELLAVRILSRHVGRDQITIAHDASEAFDLLYPIQETPSTSLFRPTLILLDLKLPRVTGLEVLQRLKSDDRTRLIPVIILTSSREERDVVTAYRLGANSFVVKDIDYANFAQSMGVLLDYWLRINEPVPKTVSGGTRS